MKKRLIALILAGSMVALPNMAYAEESVENADVAESIVLESEAEPGEGAEDETSFDASQDSGEEQDQAEVSAIPALPEVYYGWYLDGSDWYYYGSSGKMVTGWQYINHVWYYLDGNNAGKPGVMASDCKMVINGKTYFFQASGAMQTGWVKRPEGWYYTDKSGAMVTGWQYINNVWYYLDGSNAEYPGLMLADCKESIGDAVYRFRGSGAMVTGWYQAGTDWYYYDASGAEAYGWRLVNGRWYYLDRNNTEKPGVMAADSKMEIGGKTYFFRPDGSMLTGWHKEEGDWYYYDTSGAIASGWRLVKGVWYYLDPSDEGKMAYGGWKVINGKRYYLYDSGAMAAGWLLLGSDWYYLGSDGAMKTGWQSVGGLWYYMYTADDPHGGSEGVMAKDTTIDGYQLSSSGAWLTAEDIMARNVLDRVGWNLRAAFNWSAGLTYYRMTADASPGSAWFANYGFTNGKGNCYVMAATFCYMARQLGYDAHQMAGVVPRRGGGTTPHSWCEVVINGTTYVFDPNFTNETGGNGYQITYGTSGTWRYSNYYRMN